MKLWMICPTCVGCLWMGIVPMAHAQDSVTVYEFYHAWLDHYFRTADAGEAAGIDNGAAGAGWSRTGDDFTAYSATTTSGNAVTVCRFYGSVSPGPNSHFYTASQEECDGLKALQLVTPDSEKRWNYEGLAFAIVLPTASACPAGTTSIYRLYNNGFAKGEDSNHRYTSLQSQYQRLQSAGWGGEGVVMCSPSASSSSSFASLSLYSADSPFNQKVDPNPEIDPSSAMLISGFSGVGQLILQVKKFAAPVYFADENTPRHDVTLECGPVWELGVSMMKDVPIPDWAEPGFDGDPGDPLPVGCGEGSDQDNHMIILDLSTRCEYDFWQASKTNGQWAASWGNSIQMDSNGVYPKGLSARGSGFAFLGGVIWPDELQAGSIEHTLVFVYPFPKSGGPVPPATDSDGVSERGDAIPEGALLQLNPDLDLDNLNLTHYEKTIAKALQEYGMILVDGGGDRNVGLQAIDPKSVAENPYLGVLPDEDWITLPNISLKEFRVLKLPPQISNWREDLDLVSSGCGVFQ